MLEPTKAEELREDAAAKAKEAHDILEARAKELGEGKTADDITSADLEPEQVEKFDSLMEEHRQLHDAYTQAAKDEGRMVDHREAMDFYYSKSTGKPGIPWGQIVGQEIKPKKTLGQRFVESEDFQRVLKSGGLMGDSLSVNTARMTASGPLGEVEEVFEKARRGDDEAQAEVVEILREMKAASDLIYSGTPGAGADAFVQNMLIPGFIGMPQRPLTVRDLFTQGNTTSDTIEYVRQTNFDSGAAAVPEPTAVDDDTALKPQSSIAFGVVQKPVETIATYMAATRRQLADVAQLQSIIDSQGRLMISIKEEDYLVGGTGATPQLQGFSTETGVQTYDVAVGADFDASGLNNLMAIRTARRMVATGAQRGRAEAIIVNPNDSEEIDLLRDSNGAFRGGNPVGNFTFNQPLWGLTRVESEAVTEGKAYVGMFSLAASVLQRMPITVFTADQHSDWFLRNIIAILFEERLGFPIYRPSLIVEIRFADWGEQGS